MKMHLILKALLTCIFISTTLPISRQCTDCPPADEGNWVRMLEHEGGPHNYQLLMLIRRSRDLISSYCET